jgi:hypothetical protein
VVIRKVRFSVSMSAVEIVRYRKLRSGGMFRETGRSSDKLESMAAATKLD